MVASGQAATAERLERQLAFLLSRSLAADGISDDLIDMLNEVLADRPGRAARSRTFDGLLDRLVFLVRRRRPSTVMPLSGADAARINDRFGRATRQLLQVVPHRVTMYPTEEVGLLLALRDETPAPDAALPYLRRYALAIVGLLDLMGDDE
ncbi:hypothetical protein ACFVT5_42830 [Streptomyces sp. NPDC058001]|uniref:hypothetical protein n=1 Tax=Streptomyces sp. NPDC058001 TaxID=3346300 RepID=UPI0036E3996F